MTFPRRNKFEYLFYWYQYYTNKWMKTLYKNHHKIKSFEFSIEGYLLAWKKTIPIVYFTTISRSMYTIKLPTMSCLSNLSIKCSIYFNGDEHMFESIHQLCPQLQSLTLESFNIDIPENYNNRSNKIPNQPLQPNVYLKELCIGGLFNDSKCYDYLSFKYPYLESLSLYLEIQRYPELLLPFYRSSIYKMIIQYNCLKKLKVRFKSNSDQRQFWPHTELLEWFQQNPTQLSYLDYP